MKFNFKEDLLQFIWEQQLFDKTSLKTNNGDDITIINPGFLNSNSGPDFENATIKIGATVFYGSVEIHIEGRDWNQHAHHENPHYNTVVLHVCYSISSDVFREDRTTIPSLELQNRINMESLNSYKNLLEAKPFNACQNLISSIKPVTIINWIDRMIIERLEERCALFDAHIVLANNNWNQGFYMAIVRSFGMPVNSEAFEEISIKLPFDIVAKHSSSLFQLESLFFGISNLLEREMNDQYAQELKKEYWFLSQKYNLTTINTSLKFGRMRPMNLPTVKLAQLAAFFHHQPNFINELLLLPELSAIRKNLDFQVSPYWLTHYTFTSKSDSKSKKLSQPYINHILLNAIIPFVFFYEKRKKDLDSNKALQYLSSLPSENNSIIQQWKSIGIQSSNALCSQALLHLYKSYCMPKKCLQCNIGRTILINNNYV